MAFLNESSIVMKSTAEAEELEELSLLSELAVDSRGFVALDVSSSFPSVMAFVPLPLATATEISLAWSKRSLAASGAVSWPKNSRSASVTLYFVQPTCDSHDTEVLVEESEELGEASDDDPHAAADRVSGRATSAATMRRARWERKRCGVAFDGAAQWGNVAMEVLSMPRVLCCARGRSTMLLTMPGF